MGGGSHTWGEMGQVKERMVWELKTTIFLFDAVWGAACGVSMPSATMPKCKGGTAECSQHFERGDDAWCAAEAPWFCGIYGTPVLYEAHVLAARYTTNVIQVLCQDLKGNVID